MTLHLVQLERKTDHKSFRLTRGGAVTSSDTRPDVVLPVEQARLVLAAAARNDVSSGGAYSPGPAGVQVWSGPWNGPTGGRGTAEHLGSVDWSYDTPVTQYVTVYRIMLTAAGADLGLTTDLVLSTVLALGGISVPADTTVAASVPLPRDPFSTSIWKRPLLTGERR